MDRPRWNLLVVRREKGRERVREGREWSTLRSVLEKGLSDLDSLSMVFATQCNVTIKVRHASRSILGLIRAITRIWNHEDVHTGRNIVCARRTELTSQG